MSVANGTEEQGQPRDFVGYAAKPPDPRWPGGALIAVNIVVNYEEGAEFNLLDDGVNDSWGEYESDFPSSQRDLGTESHMEFGSRVGIWRLSRLLESRQVPFTLNACGRALERNPAFCDWLRQSSCDIMGHGYRWEGGDSPGAPSSRAHEAEQMARAIKAIERTTGKRPLGWNVRSFPSVHTLELVAEEGSFLYDSDSYNDEVPYYVDTSHGPLLIVPYTQLYNDTRYFSPPMYSTPRHFVENLKSGLDYLIQEAHDTGCGRMFSVGLHARWSGQPSRARAVQDFVEYAGGLPEVSFMRRADIATHWLETRPHESPLSAES
jgi:peptidoglycan/xylan/chitin deacetylase (PgdA/CDA1 family)